MLFASLLRSLLLFSRPPEKGRWKEGSGFARFSLGSGPHDLLIHSIQSARNFLSDTLDLQVLDHLFDLGSGPRSLRAIASLRATALPITFRFAPQERQYCKPGEDSVAHCGQYIDGHRLEHIIVTVSDSQSNSARAGLRTRF